MPGAPRTFVANNKLLIRANIVPWIASSSPMTCGRGHSLIVHVQGSRALYQSERTLFEEGYRGYAAAMR